MFEDDQTTVEGIKAKFEKLSCEKTVERLKDNIEEHSKFMMARHKRRSNMGGRTKGKMTAIKSGELYSLEHQEKFMRRPALESWLKIVRFFRSVISAYRALRMVGYEQESYNERNVLERYLVSTTISKAEENSGSAILASFNPRLYVIEKEMRIPQPVILAMQKRPSMRREEDVNIIYTVMSGLHGFQSYPPAKRMELARYLKYFRVGPRRHLLKRSSDSMLVYFLFAGEVCLLVNNESLESDSIFLADKVIMLKRGSCFGNTQRSPQCMTLTECELLVIEKDLYFEHGFDSVHHDDLVRRFEFFREWPPVDNWSDNAIYDLASISFTEEYPCGRTIIKDIYQYSVDLVWFVVSGRMDVIRKINKSVWERVKTRQEDFVDPLTQKNRMLKFLDTSIKVVTATPREGTETGPCSKYEARSSKKIGADVGGLKMPNKEFKSETDQVFIKLRSLEKGECFGLENLDLSCSYQQPPQGRLCLISRNCEIIRISKTQLISLINILDIDMVALKNATHDYYEDYEICEKMSEMKSWNVGKQLFVESQVNLFPTSIKLSNFAQHYKAGHGKKIKYDQPNYRSPMPILKVGGLTLNKSQNPYLTTIKSVDSKNRDLKRYQRKNECTMK